jgi:hypothetical protein
MHARLGLDRDPEPSDPAGAPLDPIRRFSYACVAASGEATMPRKTGQPTDDSTTILDVTRLNIYEIREILRANVDSIRPKFKEDKKWLDEDRWEYSGLDACRAALLELNKIEALKGQVAPALHNGLLAGGDVVSKPKREAEKLVQGQPFSKLHTTCSVLLEVLELLPPKETLTITVQREAPVTVQRTAKKTAKKTATALLLPPAKRDR